jgi:hypothetical protein
MWRPTNVINESIVQNMLDTQYTIMKQDKSGVSSESDNSVEVRSEPGLTVYDGKHLPNLRVAKRFIR